MFQIFYSVTLLILTLLIYFLKLRWQTQRLRLMINKFDGPPTIPVFGNVLQFVGSSTGIFKAAGRQLISKYNGKPIRIWIFHKPFVILSDPKDIQIASRFIQKESMYKFLADYIGHGLVTASPNKWKKSRFLLNPAFKSTVISSYYLQVFNKRNAILVEKLMRGIGMGKTFDIWPHLLGNSIHSIYETIMGIDENISEETIKIFGEKTEKVEELVRKRGASPWLYPSLIYKVYLYCIGCHNLYKEVREFHSKAFQKKKHMFKERRNSNVYADANHKPIIDLLLETSDLSDEELTDEILSLLFAGTESTAVTVTMTLFMLAKHQDIQEMVYQELYKVFGDSNRLVEAADLPKLTFLQKCIKETQRMYTIFPVVLRQATEDVILSDNSVIPAGTGIIMSYVGLHHNPNFFSQPNVWNPYNYDEDKVKSRPMNTSLPFGSGPRMCIGHKFSMVSISVLLCTLVRNFKFTTNQTRIEVNKNKSFMLKCTGGCLVELSPR